VSRRRLRWALAITAVTVEVGLALWFYVIRRHLGRGSARGS
jgi:hypothetical protein